MSVWRRAGSISSFPAAGRHLGWVCRGPGHAAAGTGPAWCLQPAQLCPPAAVTGVGGCRVGLCRRCAFGALGLMCRERLSEERMEMQLLLPLLPPGGGTSRSLARSLCPRSAAAVGAGCAGISCVRGSVGAGGRRSSEVDLGVCCSGCTFSLLPFLSGSQRSFLSRDALSPYPECPIHAGAVGCFPPESWCPPLCCLSRHCHPEVRSPLLFSPLALPHSWSCSLSMDLFASSSELGAQAAECQQGC